MILQPAQILCHLRFTAVCIPVNSFRLFSVPVFILFSPVIHSSTQSTEHISTFLTQLEGGQMATACHLQQRVTYQGIDSPSVLLLFHLTQWASPSLPHLVSFSLSTSPSVLPPHPLTQCFLFGRYTQYCTVYVHIFYIDCPIPYICYIVSFMSLVQ